MCLSHFEVKFLSKTFVYYQFLHYYRMAEKEPPPLLKPHSPLQPPINANVEQTLKEILEDYKLTQKTIKECIIVLSDETRGLMSRNFMKTVGDIINKNKIDLEKFLRKLKEIDTYLNEAISYLEWLKMNIVQLEKFEEKLKMDTQDKEIRIENSPVEPTIRMFDKERTAIKGLVISPICTTAVGVAGGAIIGAGVLGIYAGLFASVGILSAIGVSGVAGAGVGALATGAVVGFVGGAIIGIGIWLMKAYEIGKARKATYSQIEEMDNGINEKNVIRKLYQVNSNLERTIRLVKDANDPNYHLEMSFKTNGADTNRAILTYRDTHSKFMEMGRDLPQEKRIEMAETAARDACKAALAKDPIYSSDQMIDTFIQKCVNTGKERGNSHRFSVTS